ncbi:MAG: hypothetical protein JW940_23880 [Polyangiaceae bacterium]|nr:hypothetical protein [Polyangiaceae bacterium]
MTAASIEIRHTPIGGDLRAFLSVVDYIYRDDPNYVRALDFDIKQRLSARSPFFKHAEGVVLTAHRNGWCVGRCTAQVDREHLARYRDDVGFFGFFDTIDDAEVARELLHAAQRWLEQRGMKKIRGPLSLSTNDEFGCLVDGFDTPPMIMMPHHRPYQGGLIEHAGLARLKDAFAWRYTVGDVPKRAQQAHDQIEGMPGVRSRHVDMRTLDSEIRVVMDVYNDAWSDNWGYVPMTEAELSSMARELKMIIDPELTYITEVDGYPAAVALALPNINELTADLHGKLLGTGLPKLLWRLKVERPKTARLIILGVRKKYRNTKKYAGLGTYLYVKMNQAAARRGLKWGELSWTLEDNGPINVGIKFMGGKVYKRYRVYERELAT